MRTKTNSKPRHKLYMNREVSLRKTFFQKGTFESWYLAKKWLTENGYAYGSMSRDQPIGLIKVPEGITQDEVYIAKWYNLDDTDILRLDGVMTSTDFREAEVVVTIFK